MQDKIDQALREAANEACDRMGIPREIVQQAQAVMQRRRDEAFKEVITGEADGGLCKVEIQCTGKPVGFHIDPELLKGVDTDSSRISDLMVSAWYAAMAKVESFIEEAATAAFREVQDMVMNAQEQSSIDKSELN